MLYNEPKPKGNIMLETLLLFALVITVLFVGIIIGIVSTHRDMEREEDKPITLFSSGN